MRRMCIDDRVSILENLGSNVKSARIRQKKIQRDAFVQEGVKEILNGFVNDFSTIPWGVGGDQATEIALNSIKRVNQASSAMLKDMENF